MDNIGFVKTHTVSIVEIGTDNETKIDIRSGEDMSSGATVIRGTLNGQEITAVCDTYFKAFQQFRDKLLEAGYGMKCNGAHLNVAPLSRYENGPKAYVLEQGKPADKDSAVDIWAKADIDEFPDSGKQNRFYNNWSAAQKAVEEKEARKAPLTLKILVLAPLIINFIWRVALLFDSNWDYRWNLADLHVFVKVLIFYGVCFTITAGLTMAIIGTVMACRRKNKPFKILGFISFIDCAIPIVYLFLAVFFGGVP